LKSLPLKSMKVIANKFDPSRQGAESPPLVACAKAQEKGGARAMMTPKQKLEMHIKIVQDNARKLKEWKERGKAA